MIFSRYSVVLIWAFASLFGTALADDGAHVVSSSQIEKPPETQTKVSTFEITLPTLLDGRYIGDIAVRMEGDNISFNADRLLTLLKPDFTPLALATLESTAQNGSLTTTDRVQIDGVQINYNRQLQQVEISSSNAVRKERELMLGVQFSDSNIPVETPAKMSLFITPTVSSEYIWEGDAGRDTGLAPLRGILEVGGRIGGEKGIAFLSRHSFQTGADSGLTRDETQLIYDILPRTLRVTAGDLRPRGTSFQTIPSVGGISVERFFDLEPNRLFRPTGQSSFELERPSTVEIRINGLTQREIFLQPGVYNLQDLPLVQGSNIVDIVIRDDAGREQIITQRNFFDFDLLETGVMDFSLSAGVKSRLGSNAPFYTDEPVLSSFIRRGLSPSLTLGANIQADKYGANGGFTSLWASPIGVLRLEGSASQRKQFGSGYAANIGYRNTGQFGASADGWRWSANATGQFFSEDFATISDDPFNDNVSGAPNSGGGAALLGNQPVKSLFNAGFQMTKPRWSANIGVNYSLSRSGLTDSQNYIAGVSYAIAPSWNVGIFGNYSKIGNIQNESLVLQLNWRPSRNTDVRARYDTSRRTSDISYRKNVPENVGSLSYGANVSHSIEEDQLDISGDAFYTGNRFEASARHDVNILSSFSNNRTQVSRLTLASSFVFADGDFSIGRPIRDTFAIVKPHSTIKSKTVYIDPSERGYPARTDFLGAAVVPDMVTFSKNSIYVDVYDLPQGYDLGSGQFTVRPPLFSGYNFTVGSGASYALIGKVVERGTQKPLAYIGGKLTSLDHPDSEPIPTFTNRNGRLAATSLKPGKYMLTLFTNPAFTKVIAITEGETNLIDIGHIEVDPQ